MYDVHCIFFYILPDQLAQIKQITHAKVLCSVLKDDHGDISYQARLFKRQHQERWVIMKILEYEQLKKSSLFLVWKDLTSFKER